MQTLKRKHARCVRVLTAAALLFAALTVVMYDLVRAESLLWAILGGISMMVCLTAGIAVRTKLLCCPYCGKGLAVPRWNPGTDKQYCPKCGQRFVFDDETEEDVK